MRLPRRVLSPEFIAAWQAYERANARAADMYEAFPLTGQGVRIRHCTCGAVALDLCRACRKEKP
jgi:hypothetical protein